VKANLNIERAILATIIYAPEKADSIISDLQADDFFLPAHKGIFEAIEYLELMSLPIDEEFIKKHYKSGIFDDDVMFEILSTTPLPSTEYYIQELKELSHSRHITHTANEIISRVANDEDVSDLLISISKLNTPAQKINPITADKIEAQEPQFVCKQWLPIPKGTLTLISAAGGTGKSWLALQLALRYIDETGKKAFLWLSEDRASVCKDRLLKISEFSGLDINNLLHIETTYPPLLLKKGKNGTEIDPYFYQIKKALRHYEFIVLDPLLAFYGGNENDNSEARTFMQPFMNWAAEENKSIIFLHHSRKNNQDGENKVRGAGAFVDAVRCAYEIEKIYKKKALDDERLHEREIKLTKDNWGAIVHLKDYKCYRQLMPIKSSHTHKIEYAEVKFDDLANGFPKF